MTARPKLDATAIEEFRQHFKQTQGEMNVLNMCEVCLRSDPICDLALQALEQQWVSVAERLPVVGRPVEA